MNTLNRQNANRVKPNQNQQKAKSVNKTDKFSLFNLLDKCSQILKDDRLILRNNLKEGDQEVELIISKHKKNTDIHALQIELRKYLHKLKGKNSQQQQSVNNSQNLPPTHSQSNHQSSLYKKETNNSPFGNYEAQDIDYYVQKPLENHNQAQVKVNQFNEQEQNQLKQTDVYDQSKHHLQQPQFFRQFSQESQQQQSSIPQKLPIQQNSNKNSNANTVNTKQSENTFSNNRSVEKYQEEQQKYQQSHNNNRSDQFNKKAHNYVVNSELDEEQEEQRQQDQTDNKKEDFTNINNYQCNEQIQHPDKNYQQDEQEEEDDGYPQKQQQQYLSDDKRASNKGEYQLAYQENKLDENNNLYFSNAPHQVIREETEEQRESFNEHQEYFRRYQEIIGSKTKNAELNSDTKSYQNSTNQKHDQQQITNPSGFKDYQKQQSFNEEEEENVDQDGELYQTYQQQLQQQMLLKQQQQQNQYDSDNYYSQQEKGLDQYFQSETQQQSRVNQQESLQQNQYSHHKNNDLQDNECYNDNYHKQQEQQQQEEEGPYFDHLVQQQSIKKPRNEHYLQSSSRLSSIQSTGQKQKQEQDRLDQQQQEENQQMEIISYEEGLNQKFISNYNSVKSFEKQEDQLINSQHVQEENRPLRVNEKPENVLQQQHHHNHPPLQLNIKKRWSVNQEQELQTPVDHQIHIRKSITNSPYKHEIEELQEEHEPVQVASEQGKSSTKKQNLLNPQEIHQFQQQYQQAIEKSQKKDEQPQQCDFMNIQLNQNYRQPLQQQQQQPQTDQCFQQQTLSNLLPVFQQTKTQLTSSEIDPAQDQIMIKYKQLFTSPDLLKKCKIDHLINGKNLLNQQSNLQTYYGSIYNNVNFSSPIPSYKYQISSPANSSSFRGFNNHSQYLNPGGLSSNMSQQQFQQNQINSTPSQNLNNKIDVEKVYSHLFTNWDLLLGKSNINSQSRISVNNSKMFDQSMRLNTQNEIHNNGKHSFEMNHFQPQNSIPLVTSVYKQNQYCSNDVKYNDLFSQTNQLNTISSHEKCMQAVDNITKIDDNIKAAQATNRNNLDDFLLATSTKTVNTSPHRNILALNQQEKASNNGQQKKINSNKKIMDSQIQTETKVKEISQSNDKVSGFLPESLEKNVLQNSICENAQLSDFQSQKKQTQVIQKEQEFDQQEVENLKELLYLDYIYAEDLFDEIFTDSSLSKISKVFFRFKIESVVLELSQGKIQNVKNDDIDRFFELCDLKKDGFLDVNELGPALLVFCNQKSKDENFVIEIFEQLDQDSKGYITFEDVVCYLDEVNEFLNTEDDQDNQIIPSVITKELFEEVDEQKKGVLSYWEIYLCKNTYQFKRIAYLFQKLLNQDEECQQQEEKESQNDE